MTGAKADMKKRIAVYPGSFDPVTKGHLALIEKAVSLFDLVYVAVAQNMAKQPTFSAEIRVALLEEVTRRFGPSVKVTKFDGLVVAYAREKGAKAIVRGLRAVSDFEYELQMALTNRQLNESVETVFLVPSSEFFYLSSGLIKDIARLGGDVSGFVPEPVKHVLEKHFSIEANRVRKG